MAHGSAAGATRARLARNASATAVAGAYLLLSSTVGATARRAHVRAATAPTETAAAFVRTHKRVSAGVCCMHRLSVRDLALCAVAHSPACAAGVVTVEAFLSDCHAHSSYRTRRQALPAADLDVTQLYTARVSSEHRSSVV